VAVNYRAVILAHSTAAFAAKLSIVIEEADESDFWVEFALDENLTSTDIAYPLMREAKELSSILLHPEKQFKQNNYNSGS
jgi:four helix bundle protein